MLIGIITYKFVPITAPAEIELSQDTFEQTSALDNTALIPESTLSAQIAVTPMATPSSILGVKTKTLTINSQTQNQAPKLYSSFQISYPTTWSIKENKILKQEDGQLYSSLILVKGKTNLSINQKVGMTPGCSFSGDANEAGEGVMVLTNPQEIYSSSSSWKIAQTTNSTETKAEYYVCEKDPATDTYNLHTTIGQIMLTSDSMTAETLSESIYMLEQISLLEK